MSKERSNTVIKTTQEAHIQIPLSFSEPFITNMAQYLKMVCPASVYLLLLYTEQNQQDLVLPQCMVQESMLLAGKGWLLCSTSQRL